MSSLPPVQWRRSSRARRIRLALCPWRGIEIVVPRQASEAQAKAFLDSRRDWMESAWARLQRRVPEAFDTSAPDSLELAAIGRRWTIDYDPDRKQLSQSGAV
ncbi:MAG: YgjP-like metallopeptidase domain-containing protein, partial [Natronomonas sp.]